MIKLKIDVTKIPKERLFKGQKGTYLDAVLMENRGGPDQYGWDGFVSMDTTKEERDAGTKGVIIGNWKHLGGSKPASKPAPKPAAKPPYADKTIDEDGEDIPF